MNSKILPYAMDFASFLMDELKEKETEKVKSIVLFGSAARGQVVKNSDIDILLDVMSESEAMERRTSFIVEAFYKSAKFRQWKLLGIGNRISCIVGRLDKWKELKTSVMADGIVLFGKYIGSAGGKASAILHWGKVKPESKRVLLSKKLYGYLQAGRKYQGLVEKSGATKLGTNCIMTPLESARLFERVFEGLGIQVRVMHVQKMG